MANIFVHNDGLHALKPEFISAAVMEGCKVYQCGYAPQKGDILIGDCRPKGFKGGRSFNDPQAFNVYVLIENYRLEKISTCQKFTTAIQKAKKVLK